MLTNWKRRYEELSAENVGLAAEVADWRRRYEALLLENSGLCRKTTDLTLAAAQKPKEYDQWREDARQEGLRNAASDLLNEHKRWKDLAEEQIGQRENRIALLEKALWKLLSRFDYVGEDAEDPDVVAAAFSLGVEP